MKDWVKKLKELSIEIGGKSWGSEEEEGEFYSTLYSGGKTPEYGSIETLEDLQVAFVQKRRCGRCGCCYWSGRNCGIENVMDEMFRVFELEGVYKTSRKKKKSKAEYNIDEQVTCSECVYATDTNPRICLCPSGIAKHSYVKDDDYCNKGEKRCVI